MVVVDLSRAEGFVLALPRVGLDSTVLVAVASVQHVLVFNHCFFTMLMTGVLDVCCANHGCTVCLLC